MGSGSILDVTTTLGVVIALGIAVILVAEEVNTGKNFGASQSILYNTFHSAQKELVNVDSAAQLALEEGINHLSINSGYTERSDCGNYYDIPLWSWKEREIYKSCEPNIYIETQKYFEKEFSQDHKYFARDELAISGFGLKEFGDEYVYKKSFTVSTPYSLDPYERMSEFIEAANNECSDKEDSRIKGKELTNCVNDSAVEFGMEIIADYTDMEISVWYQEQIKKLQNSNYDDCAFSVEENEATQVSVENALFSIGNKRFQGNFENDDFTIQEGFIEKSVLNYEFKQDTDLENCAFEERRFGIVFNDGIDYIFSFYVKDDVNPSIDRLIAFSNEFDEDAVLIRWSHTTSDDLKKYEIYIDDVLVEEITPWRNVQVHDKLEWEKGEKTYKHCEVKDSVCFYDRLVLEENIPYFFTENEGGIGEWVFVQNGLSLGEHVVKIIAYDDDGNIEEKELFVEVQDLLPLAPPNKVSFVQVPPTGVVSKILLQITDNPTNADGSEAADFSGEYYLMPQIISGDEVFFTPLIKIIPSAAELSCASQFPTKYSVIPKDNDLALTSLFKSEFVYELNDMLLPCTVIG